MESTECYTGGLRGLLQLSMMSESRKSVFCWFSMKIGQITNVHKVFLGSCDMKGNNHYNIHRKVQVHSTNILDIEQKQYGDVATPYAYLSELTPR